MNRREPPLTPPFKGGEFEFRKVTAGYGDKIVLDNVNFGIRQNDFIAVLGTNGSGKTSLINSVFGLCEVKAGEILFEGENIKNFETDFIAKNIGAVPQTVNMTYNFVVKDFIELGNVLMVDCRDLPWQVSTEDLLNINLFLNRKIMELSSGEFQRVLIAQSLVKNPKIIFLDEPLAHLDLKYQFEILQILKKLNQNGMTVVVVIHDLRLAFHFFERFVFLKDGKIFEDVLKEEFEGEEGKAKYKKIIKQVFEIEGGIFDEFMEKIF